MPPRWPVLLSAVSLVLCTGELAAHAQTSRLDTSQPLVTRTTPIDWGLSNAHTKCDEGDPPAVQPLQFMADIGTPAASDQGLPAEESIQATQSQRWIWHILPTGMVPMIGPRTSEFERYSGYGELLTTTSWLARPLSLGAFGGGVAGTPLILSRLSQRATAFVGIHYGWDYDHRWGIDKYLGYQPLRVTDQSQGNAAHDGHVWFGQYRVLYYPWGDMRWRPYLVSGLGVADLRFNDDLGNHIRRTVFAGSFGLGVKYLLFERWAVNAEVTDLIMPGTGELSTVNDVAFISGLEYRFAVPKRLRRHL